MKRLFKIKKFVFFFDKNLRVLNMGFNFNPKFSNKFASLVNAVLVYLHPLFSFICNHIFRLQRYGSFSLKKDDRGREFVESGPVSPPELKIDKGFPEFEELDDEEEKKELHFNFKFQTFEEFSTTQRERVNVFNHEVNPSSITNKYEFTYEKSGSFIHEMDTFPVEEDSYFSDIDEQIENIFNKGKEILVFDENEEIEPMEFTKSSEENSQLVQEQEGLSDQSQESYSVSDSDSESTSSECERSLAENSGFLSDRDFETGGLGARFEVDKMESDGGFLEETDSGVKNFDEANSDDIDDYEDESKGKKLHESSSLSDSGDGNKLESLWEHQELIDQLKMELKNAREIGLPTIFEEESETPKIVDDLKPWKIDDQKMQHEDYMGELHKCYKSYSERMRKFDILNYQKMYAMGFLQLTDPLQSISNQKRSPPTLRSLVSRNLWLFKHKVHGSDPVKKFVKELEGDLEIVYIGQTCLSWEFLHWQYQKALELWDSDSHGSHRYNEIAGEFQQYQVLLQRFIEDEAFQGPRIQSYVKNRCVLRNLLQVPVLREDESIHKGKAKKNDADEYAITSEMLVEMMEESIRLFWEFIRADKDCVTAANKKMQDQSHNHEDLKLLQQVRKVLHKKERRLKDILRSENCILRKFRRRTSKEEDDHDTDRDLYFFSQIDIKLVSRVLNMSKINREQLLWCMNKLSRISFVNRRICIDPAFLLFPC